MNALPVPFPKLVRGAFSAITALALGGAALEAAAAPTPISGCTTITKSGSYVLAGTIGAPPGDCIRIHADFVTFDLDGHVIIGSGYGTGITTDSSAPHTIRGTVIRNGAVTKFDTGIYANEATIEKMHVFDNANVGIIMSGNGIVRDNVVSGHPNKGITVGHRTLVTGNVVTDSHEGIIANFGSTVSNNVVGISGSYGVLVYCPTVVFGNTSYNNATNLHVSGTNCTVDHNAAP